LTFLSNKSNIILFNRICSGQYSEGEEMLDSSDFIDAADEIGAKRVRVLLGTNLGNRTFMVPLRMHEFYETSSVANDSELGEVSQRELNPTHARMLAIYMLKGLISSALKFKYSDEALEELRCIQREFGTQIYMCLQPIVCNLRDVPGRQQPKWKQIKDANGDAVCVQLDLSAANILWVVDGQHRREAMNILFEYLNTLLRTRKYPKKGLFFSERVIGSVGVEAWQAVLTEAKASCTVLVEVHIGLSIDQERQMFHDLNNKGKQVQSSLALEFDTANPVNLFVKNELTQIGVRIAKNDKVEFDAPDSGSFSIRELVAICSHMFYGKNTSSDSDSQAGFNDRHSMACDLWEAINSIPGFGSNSARRTTISAQPVVLKAIGKLAYDFSPVGRFASDELLTRLIDNLSSVDFSHTNPLWRYYLLSLEQRNQMDVGALVNYLPDSTANRDIGTFDSDTAVMRFGSRHNDIIPIIGDMIRFALKMPTRRDKR